MPRSADVDLVVREVDNAWEADLRVYSGDEQTADATVESTENALEADATVLTVTGRFDADLVVVGLAAEPEPEPPPEFFGTIPMVREFWAEDPSWTNPGDGNDLVTVRDNGSFARNLTAAAMAGGAKPTWVASGINSKPSFRFTAPTSTTGGSLSTTLTANPTAAYTIVIVAQVTTVARVMYWTDKVLGGGGNPRRITGNTTVDWRGYHEAQHFVDAGTPDTDKHVIMFRGESTGATLWVDGVQVGEDLVGVWATGAASGWVIGCQYDLADTGMDGDVSYNALYNGDLTDHADYGTYLANLSDHYGIP